MSTEALDASASLAAFILGTYLGWRLLGLQKPVQARREASGV